MFEPESHQNNTDNSPEKSFFDPEYEFDAPQYADLAHPSPAFARNNQSWFDRPHEHELVVGPGADRIRFQETFPVSSSDIDASKEFESKPQTVITSKPAAPKNMKTTWGVPSNPTASNVSSTTTHHTKTTLSHSSSKSVLLNKPAIKRAASSSNLAQNNKPKENVPLQRGTSFSFGKLTKASSTTITKSSEDIELEKIQEKQHETEERLKASQTSWKHAISAGKYVPVRSNVPLTEPKEPNLTTRLSRRPLPERPAGQNEAAGSPFVSMAEKIANFSKKTPERYHTGPKKTLPAPPPLPTSSSSSTSLKVGAPVLQTAIRAQTNMTHVKSTAELEEEMMNQIKANPFKAQPIDPNVFASHGDYGVPRVQPQAPTVPSEPVFSVEKRLEMRRERALTQPAQELKPHVASTLKHEIFQSVLGVPAKVPRPLTQPISPNLHTAKLQSQYHPQMQPEEIDTAFKAQPVPDFSEKFAPHLPHKHTEPQPFTHVLSHPLPQEARLKLAEEELMKSKEARTFKAQPIPSHVVDPHAAQSKPAVRKLPTVPKPFDLRSEKIHERARIIFTDKVERQAVEEKKMRSFRSQSCLVTKVAPFVPEKSSKPLTEITQFHLNSEQRAGQRAAYDAIRSLKEKFDQEKNEKIQAEKKAQEEQEIAELRRSIVHRAQPVRHYKPIEVLQSMKKLTEPVSPAFTEKRKGIL